MENVPNAPEPLIPGYLTRQHVLNNRWLGEVQQRVRRFTFGTHDFVSAPEHAPRLRIELAALEAVEWQQTVTSANGGERRVHGKKATGGAISRYTVAEARRLQGVPGDFLDDRCPLTEKGKLKVLAQGVPLPMGRAIAKAVKQAVYPQLVKASA